MSTTAEAPVEIVSPVPGADERWVLEDDDNMPESKPHDEIIHLLVDVLKAWVHRTGRDAIVGSNIALRWDEARPAIGVDPDVYLVEPAPPPERNFKRLCTWKPGHHPPRVTVEVVSENDPEKDYLEGPNKYAASGTHELWIFDPLKFGPEVHGGPYVLQVWRRDKKGRFRRVYAGNGPAHSEELGAWLVVTDDGQLLRLADDPGGQALWPTEAENERAARKTAEAAREAALQIAEQERAAREAERAAREAAEAENERLRVEIERLRRG